MAANMTQQDGTIQEFIKKLDTQAKERGLPSGIHLMARQDPDMADIISRMIKAEIGRKEPQPGCDLCAVNDD